MTNFHENSVIDRINELKRARKWTTYKLAAKANIPYPALHNILKTPHIPTIATLNKICRAFNMSLYDFFAYCDDTANTNPSEIQSLLSLWNNLDALSKQYAILYMKGLAKMPILEHDENV